MIKHYINPKDGELNPEDAIAFWMDIKKLRPRRHEIQIKEYSDTRTKGANAYYWKVVIGFFMAEMGLGKSKSEKEYMHYDVLGQELRQVDDELRPGKTKTQQTRRMDGSEFWSYIKQCEYLFQAWYNGSFPPPHSLGYDTTKK